MKKLVSLVLAAILLAACAVPAFASVNEWCDNLPSYARFTFDYNDTVCLVATDDPLYNTTPGHITNYFRSPEWVNTTFFGVGYEVEQITGKAYRDENVIPVDLTEDGTLVYPLATASGVIVGLVWTTVEDGVLIVDGRLKDGEIYRTSDTRVCVYPTLASLNGKGLVFEAGDEIDIEEDLEGAEAVLVSVSGNCTYHKNVGSGKVKELDPLTGKPVMVDVLDKDGKPTGKKVQSYLCINYCLQDYWKNEPKWRAYRASLKPALNLVEDDLD